VFGVSDGPVSNTSLVMGFAVSGAAKTTVRVGVTADGNTYLTVIDATSPSLQRRCAVLLASSPASGTGPH